MKIEKINDNQIRCTLTAADMTEKHIQLTDLAYGSEKAHMLFSDMMKQANLECGFNPDNCPIMVEAIPTGKESLVLIITKVENPDELDTRFSRFTQPSETAASSAPEVSGADDVLDFFNKLKKSLKEDPADVSKAKKQNSEPSGTSGRQENGIEEELSSKGDMVRFYVFDTLDTVIDAAKVSALPPALKNALYHVKREDLYLLVLHKGKLSPLVFNRLCNTLSEYASLYESSPEHEAYLREHEAAVLKAKALQKLAQL